MLASERFLLLPQGDGAGIDQGVDGKPVSRLPPVCLFTDSLIPSGFSERERAH